MNDKVATAIETLRVELGLTTVSVWAPGDEDSELQAIFFAKDDAALMAAAVDYVTSDKAPS